MSLSGLIVWFAIKELKHNATPLSGQSVMSYVNTATISLFPYPQNHHHLLNILGS